MSIWIIKLFTCNKNEFQGFSYEAQTSFVGIKKNKKWDFPPCQSNMLPIWLYILDKYSSEGGSIESWNS